MVRYEVEADLTKAMECNCSHCSKKGFLLHFVPAKQFKLLSGEDGLSEYRFNTKKIAHLFCKTCGVQSFGRGEGPDGTSMVAVNARCLDDVDIKMLEIVPIDGKSY